MARRHSSKSAKLCEWTRPWRLAKFKRASLDTWWSILTHGEANPEIGTTWHHFPGFGNLVKLHRCTPGKLGYVTPTWLSEKELKRLPIAVQDAHRQGGTLIYLPLFSGRFERGPLSISEPSDSQLRLTMTYWLRVYTWNHLESLGYLNFFALLCLWVLDSSWPGWSMSIYVDPRSMSCQASVVLWKLLTICSRIMRRCSFWNDFVASALDIQTESRSGSNACWARRTTLFTWPSRASRASRAVSRMSRWQLCTRKIQTIQPAPTRTALAMETLSSVSAMPCIISACQKVMLKLPWANQTKSCSAWPFH